MALFILNVILNNTTVKIINE